MTPFIILPMFVGLELTLIAGALTRRMNEFAVAAVGALCSCLYALAFAVATALMLAVRGNHFAWTAYLAADIPFTLILVACTVITVLFLYRPLCRLIARFAGSLFPLSLKVGHKKHPSNSGEMPQSK
jgi:hypothetical protein